MNTKHILYMDVHKTCYFPLCEYSMGYLYINIWCVYKFMAGLQYIYTVYVLRLCVRQTVIISF